MLLGRRHTDLTDFCFEITPATEAYPESEGKRVTTMSYHYGKDRWTYSDQQNHGRAESLQIRKVAAQVRRPIVSDETDSVAQIA